MLAGTSPQPEGGDATTACSRRPTRYDEYKQIVPDRYAILEAEYK